MDIPLSPFTLSLSKGSSPSRWTGFDKLSPNGVQPIATQLLTTPSFISQEQAT